VKVFGIGAWPIPASWPVMNLDGIKKGEQVFVVKEDCYELVEN
jgi:hypothetical protein